MAITNTEDRIDSFSHLKPGDPWPEDRLERVEKCPVCDGTERTLLYQDLIDRLFSAPGRWTLYRCETCGSGYLDPRPTPGAISIAYKQYFTHNYKQSTSLPYSSLKRLRVGIRNGYLNRKFGYRHEPAYQWGYWVMYLLPPLLRLEWDYYARHLPSPSSPSKNKLLDIGCGNGDFLSCAREAGWSAMGIDFDRDAIQVARDRGLDAEYGAIEQMSVPTNTFDAVTLSHVLEHVHDPAKLLSLCLSCLKPGGTLWLATPNFDALGHRRYREFWMPLDPPRHLVLFNHSALAALLRKVGFETIKRKAKCFHASSVWAASDAIRKGNRPRLDSASLKQHTLLALVSESISYFNPNLAEEIVLLANKPFAS